MFTVFIWLTLVFHSRQMLRGLFRQIEDDTLLRQFTLSSTYVCKHMSKWSTFNPWTTSTCITVPTEMINTSTRKTFPSWRWLSSGMKSGRYWPTFQRNFPPPLSGRVSVSSFETSVNIYQTTRCNIPETGLLHTYQRENLKSHRPVLFTLMLVRCVFSRSRPDLLKKDVSFQLVIACYVI
jgi:hypothetical protein